MIEKITRIDQRPNHCVLLSYELFVYKNILHINLQILYIICFKIYLNIQYDVNPTSTSGDTCKTILFYFI